MTAKASGRVGGSLIIAAGTYARNSVCAVSATGHGEMFVRYGVAFEIAARVRHAGLSFDQAARDVIRELAELGGQGGIIALGRTGAINSTAPSALPVEERTWKRIYLRLRQRRRDGPAIERRRAAGAERDPMRGACSSLNCRDLM
jgi:hypothetical protein